MNSGEGNDTNHEQLTRGEVMNFIFKKMDINQDGLWNLTEVHDFMKDYAEMLHRNLSGNWS